MRSKLSRFSFALVALAITTAMMSIFTTKAQAQANDPSKPCSYCISASYYGCRVTITYTNGTQTVTECTDYRVPAAEA
ncbi:MAG: hypothetical protein E6Q24_21340 [Chitinophagaceae bacterium]|jgi:hypothetical protein|nr:MAG: hypothetical protein E6Q24_21340 [Chitinophagaceae bacterium]